MAHTVQNLTAMRETWVQSLDWEDPLEKEMATHSNILDWEILLTRGAWWATVLGVAKSRTRLNDCFHLSLSCSGEGNGNPFQCSCLENPRDRGAW